MHKFYTIPFIILTTLLFPLDILLAGFYNFKEVVKEHKGLINQKKYGHFIGDSIYKGGNTYTEIMKITSFVISK
jgi:hypothetical protein